EQCCKLRTDLIWKGTIRGSGDTDTECVVNGAVIDDCKFESGNIVGPKTGAVCSKGAVAVASKSWALICFTGTVYVVTNWIFFIMMTLAVILIIIGGAMYMLSGGDTTKAGKGKSLITYALIGLAIALVAKFIPPIVKLILGIS
ncbi:MAG: hypothetical protein Q8N55_04290, partial [bacterium]|nr:hypothetical protein [bacterium]